VAERTVVIVETVKDSKKTRKAVKEQIINKSNICNRVKKHSPTNVGVNVIA